MEMLIVALLAAAVAAAEPVMPPLPATSAAVRNGEEQMLTDPVMPPLPAAAAAERNGEEPTCAEIKVLVKGLLKDPLC